MFARRLVISLPQAAAVTFALFFFMQALIDTGELVQQEYSVIPIVDATITIEPPEPVLEIDRPEPIDPPIKNPDPPRIDIGGNSGPYIPEYVPPVVTNPSGNWDLFAPQNDNNNILPLVNVVPTYPTRALSRGIEGWCLVKFSVDGRGNVVEDSIVVVDAEPSDIFNRASIRAASRFKFQPKIENGQGIAVHEVPYVFRFEMSE